ncbi:MAG TPA: hypothetical protein PLA97_04920 [Rubrivivax sp.]|nr:hypothetical protein [Rubrivivax sp.]
MTNDELDAVYTQLCTTLGAHGQVKAPLLLARLSLLLITRLDDAAAARQCIEEAADGLAGPSDAPARSGEQEA